MTGSSPPPAGGSNHARRTLDQIADEQVQKLIESLDGKIIRPDNPDYDEERRVHNGVIDKHPALIIQCSGVADIITLVDFVRENRVLATVRGGGHLVTGGSICEKGLVIDLSAMTGVRVDPDEQIARVDPGATLGEVYRETQQFGLATPGGGATNTGVAGSTLGGGIGYIRRKYGLGIDALRSVTIVTADGQLRTASEEQNADLFWAIRGGGASFGVVASFEFDLYPVGPEVMVAYTFYPIEQGADTLRRFREFTDGAPEEATAMILHTTVPPLPMCPEERHGDPAFVAIGVYTGPVEAGKEVLAPLQELGDPIVDLSEPMSFIALHEMEDDIFPTGRKYDWRSLFADELSDNIIDRVLEYGRKGSPLSSIGVWQLDGAMGRVAADETAFPWRDSSFMISIQAAWEDSDPETAQQNTAWARKTRKDLLEADASQDSLYVGWPNADKTGEELARAAYGENYDRLVDIKNEYDPSGLFRFDQHLDLTDG